MTDRDEQFWPESHAEQLNQLAQSASHSTGPTTADARLEEDLRTVYTAYTRAGERVWARLAERLAERDVTPANVRLITAERLQTERFEHMQVARAQFPTQPAPQPKSPRRSQRILTLVAAAFVAIMLVGSALLVLASIHLPFGDTTGTSATPRAAVTPGIQLGPQPCPAAVLSSAHWETIMGVIAPQKVEGVLCGYLMGAASLQAVVEVRYGGTDNLLDIDVYTNIMSTHPSSIFRLQRLPYGDVGISNYNTLLTGQIELKPGQPAGVPSTQVQQDLYREFKWSDSAGTLVQTAFPGLYPDTTRYQAEFEQGEVNTGQGFQQWRLSSVTTAQYFAEFVLGWGPNAPTTVLRGGGKHDAKALVLIKNPSAGDAKIKLSLSRLELNTNGGIWEVTGVATDGMTITSPQNAQQLTSPVQVKGIDTAFTGRPATLNVFDHDRTEIGQASVAQSSGNGKPGISTSISYTSSFQGETQEGIVALYAYTGNHVIVGAVMVKVLLSA